MARRVTPLQRAFLLGMARGYRRARIEMTRELHETFDQINDEVDELRHEVARMKKIDAAAAVERPGDAWLH